MFNTVLMINNCAMYLCVYTTATTATTLLPVQIPRSLRYLKSQFEVLLMLRAFVVEHNLHNHPTRTVRRDTVVADFNTSMVSSNVLRSARCTCV
jgi:hypothetical protein